MPPILRCFCLSMSGAQRFLLIFSWFRTFQGCHVQVIWVHILCSLVKERTLFVAVFIIVWQSDPTQVFFTPSAFPSLWTRPCLIGLRLQGTEGRFLFVDGMVYIQILGLTISGFLDKLVKFHKIYFSLFSQFFTDFCHTNKYRIIIQSLECHTEIFC